MLTDQYKNRSLKSIFILIILLINHHYYSADGSCSACNPVLFSRCSFLYYPCIWDKMGSCRLGTPEKGCTSSFKKVNFNILFCIYT